MKNPEFRFNPVKQVGVYALFVCAFALPLNLIPSSPAIAMSVCTGTGNTLSSAIDNYSENCSVPRQDCDPIGNGRWTCSSQVIGSNSPGSSPRPPSPSEPETLEPARPVVPPVAGNACWVTKKTLGETIESYEQSCSVPRQDCDPGRAGWVCASIKMSVGAFPDGRPLADALQPPVSPPATPPADPRPPINPPVSGNRSPSLSSEKVVTVDPHTQQFVGSVSKLDRSKFFNMHDNHLNFQYNRQTVERYVNDLEAGHGRMFYSPMTAEKSQISNGNYPSTQFAREQGPQNIREYYANPLRDLASNRQVITDHPRNVMTPGNNPVKGARWAADYFTYYFDDDSRPLFYEPMNEPFVHAGDFESAYGSQAKVRDVMTDWYAEIGKEFKRRPELANMKVIGYASAWPSMERFNFGHWNDRMKRFIDRAGPHIDAFSVHLYDGTNIRGAESERSGSNSQAILDLIETYSMIRLGTVKPHAITEYGNIVDRPDGQLQYSEAANSQSIKSFNYILLELLERENRILTSIPFATGYSGFYWQNPARGNGHPYVPSLWRPNRDNIRLENGQWEFVNQNAANNYLLNKSALFYEFWKGVKGERSKIYVNDPDVQGISLVDNDKVHVILSNLESGQKTIDLNMARRAGYQISSVDIERLLVPQNRGATLASQNSPFKLSADESFYELGRITLQENEFVKLTIFANKPIDYTATARKRTYYATDYLKPIAANTPQTFKFNGVDRRTDSALASAASLRISMGRDHNRSKRPVVEINGVRVTTPTDWPGYDQANRHSFFGAITVPFDHKLLKQDNNTVEITYPDSGGHVSSVVLDVNNVSSR